MKSIPQTKQDVLTAIEKNQDRIRSLGVKKLGLFGSFVRQEQSAESDIDFLVEFEPGKRTFDNFMGLSFFLEELLQRRVELVTTEALSPHIGPYILEEVEYALLAS